MTIRILALVHRRLFRPTPYKLLVLLAVVALLYCCTYQLLNRIRRYGLDEESYKCKLVVNSSSPRSDWTQLLSNGTTPGGIPTILHFVYRNVQLLDAYRAGVESCTRLNGNWTPMLWTDDAAEQFLSRELSELGQGLRQFPHKLQRADAIRYVILYRFGGVYLDLDMHCRQPLLPSLANVSCFLDREREHQTQIIHGRGYSAMNSAMGCTPRHPFFKRVIEFVFHRNRLRRPFTFPNTILRTTGPQMLTDLYNQWTEERAQPQVTLLGETFFSPYINPRSPVFTSCRHLLRPSFDRHKKQLSVKERACVDLERLGFEKSDAAFVTNSTVAIHQFTHLGYHNYHRSGFHALKQFPRVLVYTNICWL